MEDNEADVFLIREAIQSTMSPVALHIVKDGEQAVRFFDHADGNSAAPCPALVILDINLPRRQGGDVLQHIRKSRRCGNTLVIAISSSKSTRDRDDMLKLGANSFFSKPSEYDDFMKLGDLVKELFSAL